MFRKHKTDDEYVESQRKLISLGKWFALVGVILILGLFAGSWNLFLKLSDMAASYDEGYQFGFFLGGVSALFLYGLAMCAGAVFRLAYPPRIVRLLIEYHDRLKKAGLINETGDSNAAN